ncbi:MAG TPA: EI24 domain-containing protein [Thermohalobaculum sp.]|nr:EI24 domain-containing protein [Thermohalobaculum sp.]
MGVINDFMRAVGQVFDARFVGVLLRAVALTLGLMALVSLGAIWLVGLLPPSFDLPWIGAVATPFTAVRGFALGAMVWLSAFLMFPVAAMFVNLYLDRIVEAVEARHYPGLPPGRAMGLGEALGSGLKFTLIVLAVNLVAMILYLISGPFAPLVFWIVNGYLFGREYFELVAQRRLAAGEAGRLRGKYSWRVWLAGSLMAVPLSVPVVNLIVPLLGVATYTHMYHRLAQRDQARA